MKLKASIHLMAVVKRKDEMITNERINPIWKGLDKNNQTLTI